MENKLIKEILEDIYLIDSDLRKNEKELIKIIEELIKAKPEAKFDKNFFRELRQEVLEKVESIEAMQSTNIFNFNFMKKQLFVGGGVLVGLVLMVVFFSLSQNSAIIKFSDESLNFKSKITRLDSQAFGSVGDIGQTSDGNESAKSQESSAGLGGGGTYITNEAKMIAPNRSYYDYVYVGDDFEIPELGDVYKKVRSESAGKALAKKFNLDLGLLDLRKFKNTSLTNFNISEDREFGYQVYFNSVDNIVSINQNWDTWPNPSKDCQDEACFKSYNLTLDDIPSDERIIAIAKQGIKEYGIDVSMYGEPRVNKSWRKSYDASEDKNQAYIPDTISVIYPLTIDGQEVNDDYGYGVGLNVGVNVRYEKVASIGNIALNDFEVSSYPLEQDSERIIKFAEQGGLYKRYYVNENSTKVEVELGTPEIGLITNWKYDEETGRGDNYYIPALVFPIINEVAESYFNRQSVSIPLLPELLDQADEANEEPLEPMPLLRMMEDGEMIDEEPMIKRDEAPMIDSRSEVMTGGAEIMSR